MKIYMAAPHGAYFDKSMEIYLAGGSAGNNSYIWRENTDKPEKAMQVFLAGTHAEQNRANSENDMAQKIYVLESFAYMKDWMNPYIKNHWHFMLDSGAFTYMSDPKKGNNINWEDYVDRYAALINKLDIDLFFELDIDVVVGLAKVEELRYRLEQSTGKKSIPVWHHNRGKSYWLKMLENYDYVAIGGMVNNRRYMKQFEKQFPWFIRTARESKTKIHALGYTSFKGLFKYPFDSVDSTSWLQGNRGGFLYRFNGQSLEQIRVPKGKKLQSRNVAIHNFKEWVKFQKYANINL